MNFLDLYKRIQSIDEGLSQGDIMPQAVSAPPSEPTLQTEEETCTECGGDMPMPANQPDRSQQDSVSMNVTMSGSGQGGIRDLMNVLKNIESGQDHDAVIVGEPAGVKMPIEDGYDNEPDETTLNIGSVMPTGDDIHSKGLEAEKQAGGGNPWNQMDISESLVKKLSNHYAEVKDRVSEGYGRYRSPGSGMGWSQEAEKRAFKRNELEHELRHEEDGNGWGIYIGGKFWKAVKSERQANAIVNTLQSKGKEAKASYGSYFESNTDEGYGYRSYGKPKSYDSFGNPLGGGYDEYPDDPYGHKEAAKIRDRDRGPWYIVINNKVFTQKGEPKAFDWKSGANNYALAIIKKRPELADKMLLTKNRDWQPKQ